MEPIRLELEGYPCPCPGTPHSLEWVDLEPEVTAPMGMASVYILANEAIPDEASARAMLTPIFLRYGIRSWSFTGEKLGCIKVEPDSIARLLPFSGPGFEVADRCMDLYLSGIIAPLAARRSRLSEPGPMDVSTSPIPTSTPISPPSPTPSSPETTDGNLSEDLAL
jgi:hypothetical protein